MRFASAENLSYDADSNVTLRCTRAGLPIAYTYDTLNRLGTKTLPAPATPCTTAPSGTVVTYAYDLAGRRTGVGDSGPSITPVSVASSVQYATSMTYDALNCPTGATWTPAPTAVTPTTGANVAFTHAYNAVNQRTGQSVSDNSWISYPAATPATTGYTANNLNQYTAVGSASPTYDGNGNLTYDGNFTYAYDAENQLVSATNSMTAVGTYAFDGLGRRKLKTAGGTTTISISDADNREVLEYDGATGTILRWYAYGLGSNDLLNQMDIAAGTRTTLVPDLLGSIVATMGSTASTLTPFAYQPYGESAAPPAPFGYTGQRFDAETGLYYYRFRQYSTQLGRFLQPDPMGFGAGLNLYAYVDNDPLNYYDPYGLSALSSVHLALTAASFCPSFCGSAFSGIDAAIYAGQGDYLNAGISGGAALAGIVADAGLIKATALLGAAATDALKAAATTKALPQLKISASKYPQLAENILNAQKAGHPTILTHGGQIATNRTAALEGIPNIRRLSRDEYPFASAMEGGQSAWVGHVPVSQQNAQGALMKNFFKKNNIQPGDQYQVIIKP